MIGQQGLPLGVEVDLTGDRMTVTAGSSQVANWALEEIRVLSLPDGFHIKAEGEEVILNVDDKSRFAIEVGLTNRG
jgi:hypothetical protein